MRSAYILQELLSDELKSGGKEEMVGYLSHPSSQGQGEGQGGCLLELESLCSESSWQNSLMT